MADISNLTPEQRRQIYEEEKRIREQMENKIREEKEPQFGVFF